jgi:hypothetical protein
VAEAPGETDLRALLATMRPRLREAEYVFIRCSAGKRLPEGVVPLATFEEDEGMTAIVEQARAERAALAGVGPFAMITLDVDSSLEAVGFLATIARALAEAGIAANAVAAYHHDHLFVPVARAADALRILDALILHAKDAPKTPEP